MRWQTTILAAAFVLAGCETNQATDLIEVSAQDLEGTFELLSMAGTPTDELDPDFCVTSTMTMDADGENDGEFEMQHHFVQRTASGINQPCSTDPLRQEADVFWRGEFENTSTLIVLTILESEVLIVTESSTSSTVVPQSTELVGEFNPATGRLVARFPAIWAFNPHGASGGKISLGGDARGLGAGTMVFDQD